VATVRISGNRLPAGRYWSDLIGPKAIADWIGWKTNVAKDVAKVINSVHHEADGDQPEREFVLFSTTADTAYDDTFYAPVNTGEGINGEEDTVTKPDVPSLIPDFSGVQNNINSLLTGVALLVGFASVVAIGVAVFRNTGRK
jgi:hypothetical protein